MLEIQVKLILFCTKLQTQTFLVVMFGEKFVKFLVISENCLTGNAGFEKYFKFSDIKVLFGNLVTAVLANAELEKPDLLHG